MPIIPKDHEPEWMKTKLKMLFAKLDQTYPDRVVDSLQRDHKTYAEWVTELYWLLGYRSGKDFLEAYGYTVEGVCDTDVSETAVLLKRYDLVGNTFHLPRLPGYDHFAGKLQAKAERMFVVVPIGVTARMDPTEAETALIIQAPAIPCGIPFTPERMEEYTALFTRHYPVFRPDKAVQHIGIRRRFGILYQSFHSGGVPGWDKLQGIIFAEDQAFVFHLIRNYKSPVPDAAEASAAFVEWAEQWLLGIYLDDEYRELREVDEQRRAEREERIRQEEARRRREMEELIRKKELAEQRRRAAEAERLRKEAEERRRQEELAEQRRRAEEAERLRKEAERLRKEEERLRREAEERCRREELAEQRRRAEEAERRRIAALKERFDQLLAERAAQERIIAENKAWFGARAKLRKEAQKRLQEISQTLEREFPEGDPARLGRILDFS